MFGYGAGMSTALGDYLKREIEQRGWNRRTAEAKLELSQSTISDIINTKRMPDLPTLKKLADKLEVSFAKLLDLAGFPVGPMPTSKLTEEEEEAFNRLSSKQRAALIELARQMRSGDLGE